MTTTTRKSWRKSATHQAAEHHPPLHIDVGLSPAYLFLSLMLHLIAAAAILSSSLHSFVILAVVTALVFSAGLTLHSACAQRQVIWHSTNLIEVTLVDSAVTLSGLLIDESFHSSWFVVLALRSRHGQKYQCLIPADSVTPRAYRQLRSRLHLMLRDEFG